MDVTLQYVNARIERVITELFEIQATVAAEIEEKEKRAQELRAEFLRRLKEKNKIEPDFARIEGETDMHKLKYGEGSITPRKKERKDGTFRRYYQGRIYINGKQKSVYARTQSECLQKLKALRTEISEAKPSSSDEPHCGAPTNLADWIEVWLKDFKKDNTRRRYYNDLCRYSDKLKSALGEMKLKKIEPLAIKRYFNSLPKTNTSAKIYGVLKDCLQRAEDFGIINKNPCKVISKPKFQKGKRRAFELEEQNQILSALPNRYQAVFFFLCATGLRIGEFLALTPQSVDFRRKCINVEENQDLETLKHGETKTEAGERKVYFADELFNRFDETTLGSYSYNGIKKAFTKVYRALGIKNVSATHSCRHTYASLLYAVNIPKKVIQMQCGHADYNTTLNIYTDILTFGDSPIYKYILQLKEVLLTRFRID